MIGEVSTAVNARVSAMTGGQIRLESFDHDAVSKRISIILSPFFILIYLFIYSSGQGSSHQKAKKSAAEKFCEKYLNREEENEEGGGVGGKGAGPEK